MTKRPQEQERQLVRIHGSTVIARPVEEVFDFVADERNEPTYNRRVTRVDKLTPGAVGAGTRWSATVESRGRRLDMEMEVTDYARPSRLGSHTSMSTAEITGVLTFEPDSAGTRMSWSWELQPKGLLRVLGPLVARIGRRQEAGIWAGLKEHLEQTAPPQPGT